MSVDQFATLRPANALARLAFSDLYETFKTVPSSQHNALDAFRRMDAETSKVFDGEVLRLRLETERRVSQNAYASDAETSESLTEPDSDIESQHQELGNIWTGHYVLKLESKPAVPDSGYTFGKGPLKDTPADLLLCTRSFARWHGIDLRNPHARLSFFLENRGLFIARSSRSQSAQLTVNGETVRRRPYALNQHSMNVRLDKLEYTFQWTGYAATEAFVEERADYVTRILGGPEQIDFDMPTPLPNRRTIGNWTLGDALGAGGHGRVFLGTNSLGEVAAVKMMERTSRNYGVVDAEVQTCKEITALAEKSDDDRRILRVKEVLYTRDKNFSSTVAFDTVAVVLQPMTPRTLVDICRAKDKGSGAEGMTMETAALFRNALLGLQVMHQGGWMHRDLKPTNIGLIGTPARPVLLDNGTSAHLRLGAMMKPLPGGVGTVNYLAPELELKEYNHLVDIWAMGVILYHLTYHHHPWKFHLNPWRDCKENEKLRPQFQERYQAAVDKMERDYTNACQTPTEGYIHLGALFIDMVKHRWAANGTTDRPSISEVLAHPAWGPLLPDTSRAKRQELLFGELDDEETPDEAVYRTWAGRAGYLG